MTEANALNASSAGIVGNTGTSFTATAATAHAILVGGSTTSTITNVGPSATTGQVFQSQGASADPAFSTATYPATATGTGTILRADGTNWSATTTTYPNTNAINTLLYASSANVMSALATANGGVLATSSSGVPSIDTTNFAVLSTGLQLKGNNTNTSPPAGFIGETISATFSNVSVSTSAVNLCSITLTAGNWLLGASMTLNQASTTSWTTSISTTSGSNSAFTTGAGVQCVLNTTCNTACAIGPLPVSISGSTTYYLVTNVGTGSNSANNGRMTGFRIG